MINTKSLLNVIPMEDRKDLKGNKSQTIIIIFLKLQLSNSKQLLRVENESTLLFKGAKQRKYTKKLIHIVVWWGNGV